MIRIEHLQKFYNKSKPNQIHVINDTSLTFPEKGLVALTGPSGCGKTTLLNVIGGLDKFESGKIYFDEKVIDAYRPEQWDPIRNASIGYIFQNYNLVEDKTVYENIEIALNMAGLYHADAIEERINYVLKSVGMYNFRRRNVLALSGGQQQRVAIARAIAKNPKVVLADEPTGNLDTNNTFEIMSIIKKISQTCLVILVSHERELVEFYADRVIEILDGKIVKDYENAGNRTLEHMDDRNIYLKDMKEEKSDKLFNLSYYHDEKDLSKADIKLVYIGDTLFVKAESPVKIKYLTSDSEIQLLDEHYKKPETEDITKYLFDLNQFGSIKNDTKRKSFIRFRDTLKSGFLKFINGKKFLGRFFLIVCFVVACLVVYNLATLSAMMKESSFLVSGRNFVQVEIDTNFQYTDALRILNETSADSIVADTTVSWYNFEYENLYQGSGIRSAQTSMYSGAAVCPVPVGLSQVDASNMVAGALPSTNREVAIDVWIADQLLNDAAFTKMGISGYNDLLGVKMTGGNDLFEGLTIVGVLETNSPVAVLTDENRFYFYSDVRAVAKETAEGSYEITEGRDLESDEEILVSDASAQNIGSFVNISGVSYEIVGLFSNVAPFSTVVTNNAFQKIMVDQLIFFATSGSAFYESSYFLYFYSNTPATTVAEIEAMTKDDGQGGLVNMGLKAEETYDYLKNANTANIFDKLIFVYVGLGATIIYIIFMMRSSMLSRIREIGIYRSIGATKGDIYKIFFSEVIGFTSLGSLPGYLFMSYAVIYIQEKFNQVLAGTNALFYFPIEVFFIGLAGIYLINLLFGMIPIFTLLRKTPSEINTKYDI